MQREPLQKVTVLLPKDLVRRAVRASGEGLTPTIRRGLEAVAATEACQRLRRRRGQVKFSINVNDLRRD